MVLLAKSAFLDNPFRTREDTERALIGLLRPLAPHTSPKGALITLGSTGTHYDLRACQLEAFSRPLWGLVSLAIGGSEEGCDDLFDRWRSGLAAGTDPEGDEFWGWTKGKDQRMVEMSAIGFALATGQEKLFKGLDSKAQPNIGNWLGAINDKPMPDTNWLWFRVFANLGLQSIGSDAYNPVRLKADLDHLDTFQLRGEESGWSRDGPEGVNQLDYYSGSFAIMVAQLIYSKLAQADDPVRCENYRNRAKRFILDQMYYFDDEGRCIPFGRSMIYRFAVVATFSALAFADVAPPAPLEWGHVKGVVLRHLRWWSKQENIFNGDGTLNIGYAYPNMNMTENYNGFGSPYWCTKAFICLSVPSSHPFWSSTELPWPRDVLPPIRALPDPYHIMVRPTGASTHTYLLSSGQACHYALKHGGEKYGKFAYSSAFGFSCPTGMFGLEQMAADSMLALCDDEDDAGYGEGERWRIRRDPIGAKLVQEGNQCYLESSWKPWPDVVVDTWLFPPTDVAPCWYLRVHRLQTARKLRSAEGGWAIYGQGKDGRAIVQVFSGERSEGGLEGEGVVRVQSEAGVVGEVDLSSSTHRHGKIVQSDPNSNIVSSRTVLPTLLGRHVAGSETWLVTAVFGMPTAGTGMGEVDPRWKAEWEKRPEVPEVVRKMGA